MPRTSRRCSRRPASCPATTAGYGVRAEVGRRARAGLLRAGGRVRLESRTQRDVTSQYPEVATRSARGAGLAARPCSTARSSPSTSEGRPDFQRLQPRMHLASESAVRRRVADTPATYMVFDVLYLNGHSTMALPYADRRKLLERLDARTRGLLVPRHATSATARALLEADPRARASRASSPSASIPPTSPGSRSRRLGEGEERPHRGARDRRLACPGRAGAAATLGALALGYYDERATTFATPARSAPASPSRRSPSCRAC